MAAVEKGSNSNLSAGGFIRGEVPKKGEHEYGKSTATVEKLGTVALRALL